MRDDRSFLLRGERQLNRGAIVSGVGFLLYIGASALGWAGVAGALAPLFGALSLYVFASAVAERRRDKEIVSYNLLWGQGALALLLCACAGLTLREWLGL